MELQVLPAGGARRWARTGHSAQPLHLGNGGPRLSVAHCTFKVSICTLKVRYAQVALVFLSLTRALSPEGTFFLFAAVAVGAAREEDAYVCECWLG